MSNTAIAILVAIALAGGLGIGLIVRGWMHKAHVERLEAENKRLHDVCVQLQMDAWAPMFESADANCDWGDEQAPGASGQGNAAVNSPIDSSEE